MRGVKRRVVVVMVRVFAKRIACVSRKHIRPSAHLREVPRELCRRIMTRIEEEVAAVAAVVVACFEFQVIYNDGKNK